MPCLKITSNVPSPENVDLFFKDLSALMASAFEKPLEERFSLSLFWLSPLLLVFLCHRDDFYSNYLCFLFLLLFSLFIMKSDKKAGQIRLIWHYHYYVNSLASLSSSPFYEDYHSYSYYSCYEIQIEVVKKKNRRCGVKITIIQ